MFTVHCDLLIAEYLCNSPDLGTATYQARQLSQEFISETHQAVDFPDSRHTHGESRHADVTPAALPLQMECDDCSGAGRVTRGHPNGPYARAWTCSAWTCSACDGTGEVIAGCECCRSDAVEVFDGLMLCGACAAEQRADAMGEAV